MNPRPINIAIALMAPMNEGATPMKARKLMATLVVTGMLGGLMSGSVAAQNLSILR